MSCCSAYYALLNAGIFGIAWFKAWRLLNLLGFVCTFIVGTAWGVTRYRAGDFATTEPFLVLFFLFYVGIAVLYALRRSVEVRALCRRHDRVRHAARRGGLAAGAGAPLRIRDGDLGRRVVRALSRARARAVGDAARRSAPADRVVPRARHRVRDARGTARVRRALDVGDVGARRRRDRLGRRATGTLRGARVRRAAAARRPALAFALGGTVFVRHLPDAAWPLANREFVGALLVALGGLVTAFVYQRGAATVKPIERTLMPGSSAGACFGGSSPAATRSTASCRRRGSPRLGSRSRRHRRSRSPSPRDGLRGRWRAFRRCCSASLLLVEALRCRRWLSATTGTCSATAA